MMAPQDVLRLAWDFAMHARLLEVRSQAIGPDGGGIVITPVEVLGGFATAGSVIAYQFKLYANRIEAEIARLVAGHKEDRERYEREAQRLIDQNSRLSDALIRSTGNTGRLLPLVEDTIKPEGGRHA